MDSLLENIKTGNLVGVKKIVEEVSLVNDYSAAGLTPLGVAILHGQAGIARYLLESGADIQLGYRSDRCQENDALQSDWPEISTPIHCAAASGRSDLVRVLVDHGADVNDPSAINYGKGVLPLCLATGLATRTLIDLGADVSREDGAGFTPLVHAIAREDVETVRTLVVHGADVHVERTPKYRIRVGGTASDDADDSVEQVVPGTSSPLIVASHQGRLRSTSAQMIEILASAGADVNKRYFIKDPAYDVSFTVLSLICGSRVPCPRLKGQYAKNDQYGEKEVAAVKALINAGVDVNDPPVLEYICDGVMPFQDFGPRLEVLRMLIQHGARADVSSGVALQKTLLKSFRKTEEAESQFRDIVLALTEAGAQWSVENLDETTMPEYIKHSYIHPHQSAVRQTK